jgi:CRISPR-associated endonuclease/helicase Cas3
MMKYDDCFRKALGIARDGGPYPYQRTLATDPVLPELVRVPTSAGKTAAVILGWLWRRRFAEPEVRQKTPRRLVYCLPMRVLVEQTRAAAIDWLDRLGMLGRKVVGDDEETPNASKQNRPDQPVGGWAADNGDSGHRIAVHVLMGGEAREDWHLYPERDAILIGTQDMLLSRALNRGYSAGRFRWPIDFGLLNNDCLWVFDEPQLMGSGLSTSAQLSGLRLPTALGTFGSCPSVWMSATLEPSWLDTVDFVGRRSGSWLELSQDDYKPARPLHKRMTAPKALHKLGVATSNDGKDVARRVIELHHEKGKQTLVVLNTVDRAKAVYKSIKEDKGAPKDVLLVHSRFRPAEREMLNGRLTQPADDRIIVATQVVEAGVDLSARTLVTELAPWASLVQRIGRCNRTGDDGPGRVFWIDVDDKQAAPYEATDLRFAREQLTSLEGQDVSPKSLDDFKRGRSITLPFAHTHVIRRRDLLDLFDTAPDLSGNDIDVSRFVRGDREDSDVQVFWRGVNADGPANDESGPSRRELCNVPIGDLKKFLEKEKKGKKPTGYVWDHLSGEWRKMRDPKREVYPGLSILLPASTGGYSEQLGWHPEEPSVNPVPADRVRQEGTADDPDSCGPKRTIAEHTRDVCTEIDGILESLGDLIGEWSGPLIRSARWHDVGKAHDAFQRGIREANPALDPATLWAKSGNKARLRHGRRYFRHELASALAALQNDLPFEIAYLIATHHGKVRLSIRALPDEEPPGEGVLFAALGVHHGDRLGPVDLGGETCPAVTLDLSPMQLGGEDSWTARALAFRDEIGPFRLAYLETLLRAADIRASRKPGDRS